MPKVVFLVLFLILPALAVAQDKAKFLAFGGDLYGAGGTVVATDVEANDAFLGAQDTTLAAPITGSAHVAGQTVRISQPVAGNAYAAGQSVTLSGAVAGSATVAGQTLNIGEIGRNLRAFGQTVSLNDAIGGTALIAAQSVTINGTIAGDVMVNADRLTFGPEARIDGALTIYHSDPGSVAVPGGVLPEARITRKTVDEWSSDAPTSIGLNSQTIWRGLLSTILTVTLLAALLAALIPAHLSQVRSTFLSRPLRSFWFGFLTLSAAIGSKRCSASRSTAL